MRKEKSESQTKETSCKKMLVGLENAELINSKAIPILEPYLELRDDNLKKGEKIKDTEKNKPFSEWCIEMVTLALGGVFGSLLTDFRIDFAILLVIIIIVRLILFFKSGR